MLAQEFAPTFNAYPCYVQPKLDGVRMLANVRNGTLLSRNGTDFSHLLPIFQKDLRKIAKKLPDDVDTLDGELYVHGTPFQKIVSMVRNQSDPTAAVGLEFHVYDLIHDKGFAYRCRVLERAIDNTMTIKRVETSIADSLADVNAYLSECEAGGYEGVMVRSGDAPYENGKRSKSLLKYKKFDTDEFIIVSFREARGKDRGTPVFELESHNSKVFSARPTGTLAERRELFKVAGSMIGKPMTVKFQGLSRDGIPRFPVALVVRDYEL